ncbi:MAG: ABC-ATPase domain-containing protein [Desulfobacteraceae bacterium]|nr:ABC-ATPase domain-containing protein [Desulfobacteraceae bacterium]
MENNRKLAEILSRIDGRGFKAYKDIKGRYGFKAFKLFIDHVQGDPYSNPSRIRVRVERGRTGFGPELTSNHSRTIAFCDFLTRTFYRNCRRFAKQERGIGKSGLVTMDRPQQEILERTAMVVTREYVEARFFMGLPAFGRKISARNAKAMFFEEVPKIVDHSLFLSRLDLKSILRHIEVSEDADALRGQLDSLGLVAFVADGSLLPRASGIDPRPLKRGNIVPFTSPESFRVKVSLPNRGEVEGLGIPKGVTLILGGGYHGKSTLLNALELGVYNHVPGDGRELAVSSAGAVKIRAADGRNIEKTDISPFINNLPFGKDTKAFSTANASGSTSQAAAISEAVEAGAATLLLDEDTCATNFMVRDVLMQQLVAKENEPITPFVDRVQQLHREQGISTVLVMGGSGDYFAVADQVIQMTNYEPSDVSEQARTIVETHDTGRRNEGRGELGGIRLRIPVKKSFSAFTREGRQRIKNQGDRAIVFGSTLIDLWDLEQIVHISQTRAMGRAILHAMQYMDGKRTLEQVMNLVERDLDEKGLDILMPFVVGDLARFRPLELAAAINRMRTLKVRQFA